MCNCSKLTFLPRLQMPHMTAPQHKLREEGFDNTHPNAKKAAQMTVSSIKLAGQGHSMGAIKFINMYSGGKFVESAPGR